VNVSKFTQYLESFAGKEWRLHMFTIAAGMIF